MSKEITRRSFFFKLPIYAFGTTCLGYAVCIGSRFASENSIQLFKTKSSDTLFNEKVRPIEAHFLGSISYIIICGSRIEVSNVTPSRRFRPNGIEFDVISSEWDPYTEQLAFEFIDDTGTSIGCVVAEVSPPGIVRTVAAVPIRNYEWISWGNKAKPIGQTALHIGFSTQALELSFK